VSSINKKKGSQLTEIKQITDKIKLKLYEFSQHALDQSIIRNISVAEIEQAISENALIIEDYPNDKYGPSCLILGYTENKRPLHIQCSYASRPLVKIITLYQPDSEIWINYTIRKLK
jgi:hypothetical protein